MTGYHGDLAGVDADTPDDFDADAATERWGEIEQRGHPLGPDPRGRDR